MHKKFWSKFWFTTPKPLAYDDKPEYFFIGIIIGVAASILAWSLILGLLYILLSI